MGRREKNGSTTIIMDLLEEFGYIKPGQHEIYQQFSLGENPSKLR